MKVTFKDFKRDKVSLPALGFRPYYKVYHVWYCKDDCGIYEILPAGFFFYKECKKYRDALIKSYPSVKFCINSSLCFSK